MYFNLAILSAAFAGASAAQASRTLDQEVDYSWIVDHDIKFGSCHTIPSFGSDEADGEDIGTLHGYQNLVTYEICPSGKCKKSGEYVIGMAEFLQTFATAKFETEEANCEAVAENCECGDDGDDAACLSACYASAGYDYCEKDEDFDAAEYFECVEAPFSDGAYYSSTFYIGPACSKDGDGIILDLFKDAKCTRKANNGDYYKYSGGYSLPYSTESMVDDSQISCEDPEQEYYNGAYRSSGMPYEMCTELYEQSGKCEKDMKGKSNKDNESCRYINKILPELEGIQKRGHSGNAETVAWFFAFTTLVAAAVAVMGFTKAKGSSAKMNASSGLMS